MIEFLQTYLRFNLHGLLCFLAGVVSLSLGLLVLMKENKSAVNRAFFFLTLNIALWLLPFGAINIIQDERLAMIGISLSYVFGITFIPVSTYQFSSAVRNKNPFSVYYKSGIVLATLAALPMMLFARDLADFNTFSWGRFPTWRNTLLARVHFYFVQIGFLLYTFPAFFNFIRYWKEAYSSREKTQSAYLLLAMVFAYSGWIDFFSAFNFPVYPFGYISITLFSVTIFYTIVKHQLLDVKLTLKRLSVIFGIYALLLLITLSLSIPFVKNLLSNPQSNPLTISIGTGIAMGLIFSLGPIIYAYLVRNNYWLRGHATTGLTHELKSPLSVIESAAAIALDSLADPSVNKSKVVEYLNLIQNNTTRLQNFVRDLLSVAKSQDDEITLNREPADFSELVNAVCQIQKPLADQKGIMLTFDHNGPIEINMDAGKMRQVMSNIISNAIKFSGIGTVHVIIEKQKNEIVCQVQDQGCGLDKKHLTKIFDRFYQAKPGSKGTGIGLTIAKAWVEAHGGKIWVESEGEGKGTTVKFTLPA